MHSIHFQLVTPEKVVLSEELSSLSCPTTLGQITVMPHHVPLVATLVPGELIARAEDKEHSIHVWGGFIEVRLNNEVVLLADGAEHSHEIDTQQAEEAVGRAKQSMQEQTVSSKEYAQAATMLERNLSRLKIAKKHAHRRTAPITGQGVLEE